MTTKTDAVKISEEKWQNVVKELERNPNEEPASFGDYCGFCQFFAAQPIGCRENGCPLVPDVCIDFEHRGLNPLYWRIGDACKQRDYPLMLELSKQMVLEIQTRGKKWIGKS